MHVDHRHLPRGPVGQRDRQPGGWIRGVRAWRRVHLGRERVLLSPHPVAQRPGRRSHQRRDLPAGRRQRRRSGVPRRRRCRTTGATACGTPRAVPPSSTSTAASPPSCGWRHPPDDAVKLSLLRITNHVATPAPADRHRLRRMDARRAPRGYAVAGAHALRARAARHPRPEPLRPALRGVDRVPRDLGAGGQLHRRPHVVPRAQRHARCARPRSLRDALDGVAGVALDPCGALQMTVDLAPGTSREITVPARCRAARKERRDARSTACAPRPRRRRAAMAAEDGWTSRLGVVTVRTPDDAFDAMVNTWTLYQALVVPDVGAHRGCTRAAVRTASATSCRT